MSKVKLGPRHHPRPGVWPHPDGGYQVTLYAPNSRKASLIVEGGPTHFLKASKHGYFTAHLPNLEPGTRYRMRANNSDGAWPDPASLSQPDGVHGASEVVRIPAPATSEWRGRALADMVIYELHVGTFSEAGTFEGAIEHLDALVDLGVNTLELLPINSFPGERNWGYDGVYWQAAQASYGGVNGLRKLIDAAHERGLAVLIDAVFNHLGPEGNYLGKFAPYLNEDKRTPWGPALNTDARHSDGVRDFVLSVVHTWLVDFGADGLRLDAVHALVDSSAQHILAELAEACAGWRKQVDRPLTLIAECDLNTPRYITSTSQNGLGMDGQWVDEYHHAVRAYLTGETRGYYSDFGEIDAIEKSLSKAYVFTGEYSAHRARSFGESPTAEHAQQQFVVFGQNHDQVGNRARGERLHEHLDERDYLLMAAMVLWSPFTPMLWMGEEYAERAPFPYFVSHTDATVMRLTREGRMREFAPFLEVGEEVPDPGLPATFASAKLSHRREGRVYDFYREALRIRNEYWPLRERGMGAHHVARIGGEVLLWRLPLTDGRAVGVLANLSNDFVALADHPGTSEYAGQAPLSSSQPLHSGELPARAAAVYLTTS